VVASKKWCKINTLLLHTTNGKYFVAYRFVPFPVTLNDLVGYSPVAGLIKCDATNSYAIVHTISTDTAIAERFVLAAISSSFD